MLSGASSAVQKRVSAPDKPPAPAAPSQSLASTQQDADDGLATGGEESIRVRCLERDICFQFLFFVYYFSSIESNGWQLMYADTPVENADCQD